MAQFTGGTVRYLKRVKTSADPNEYNAPFHEAEATINYSVDAGENAQDAHVIVTLAREEALTQVMRMLGQSAPAVVPPMTWENLPEIVAVEGIVASIKEDPINPLAVALGSPPIPTAGIPPKVRQTRKRAEDNAVQPSSEAAPQASVSPAVITGEEFTRIITDAASRIGHMPIRELITEYVGPVPKTGKDISPEQRPEFVARLKKLLPQKSEL
jgi:hypothetical protein